MKYSVLLRTHITVNLEAKTDTEAEAKAKAKLAEVMFDSNEEVHQTGTTDAIHVFPYAP